MHDIVIRAKAISTDCWGIELMWHAIKISKLSPLLLGLVLVAITAHIHAAKTIKTTAANKSTTKNAPTSPPRSKAITLTRLTLASSTTTGKSLVGKVQLNAIAPAGGTTIRLSTSNAQIASVSKTKIIVPAGKTEATFTVATKSKAGTATITATLGSVTKTARLTVKAPVVTKPPAATTPPPTALTLAGIQLPYSVSTGSVAQGTISLTSNAPTGGISVSLSSSNIQLVTVSSTQILIPAGNKTATFNTTALATPGTVTITARLNGLTQTRQLVVQASASGGNTSGGSTGANTGNNTIAFSPVMVTAQTIGMVGNRIEAVAFFPIVINAQTIGMVGNRLEAVAFFPIVINTQTIGMVGNR